ncbi:BamA/TamA family outer membrane protein [Cryomorpha ignava]|uniref:BamA/TamA family outer membrane protein n=1 Tax=Cryomorpha ignava TaxID=101383 RepID=A0A7K3WTV7_9FLAO|nr:BamA/TamA family outer membrane protein [Cryomorpha ignava]NEN25127.1 BamA/TamA family outer membrane protein [Cryomorpha ignava]
MRNAAIYIIFAILLASCSANKYLPEGEKYFEGHETEYTGKTSSLPKELRYYLQEDLKPDATRRFLISRPGTWIYQVMGEVKKEKGIKHFIKFKLGTKPVYLSEVNLDNNTSIIESKLENNGFFRADVENRVDSTKHKATAVYIITLEEPYYFDTLRICTDTTNTLCAKMEQAHQLDPKVKPGKLFQKSKLQEERESIASYFKNDGYFYFVPGLTYYEADSSDNKQRVKLHLNITDSLPEPAISQYRVTSVTVNLAAGSSNTEIIGDSLKVIIDPNKLFLKPKKLKPFLRITPGELYSRKDEETTLKQLNRLEVFEFVNINYEVDTSGSEYTLRAKLLANPRPKQSARAEINLSTTSTNYTGPGVQLEYYNRNIFRGAEKLRITGTGRYEVQLTGDQKGQASYDVDLLATLLFPRVGIPLFNADNSEGNVPSTKYRLQYRFYSQPQYYTQSSFGASFGYEWLSGNATTHNDLRVMGVDYVKLLKTSDRLEQLFDEGILSRESFNDQLIVGPSYSVTYAPPPEKGKFVRFYVGGSIESAGNILYGIYNLTNSTKNEFDQYTVLKTPFAQYMRIQADFRTYYKLSKNNDLVLRQNIGVGLPYWNSSELPFSKQFFVGGASSLRGFQPRSVGPGTYYNSDQNGDGFFDQTGDILLELNAENRFDMGGFLKGAVFIDAGNVWLKNASEPRPGGEFKFISFFNQLAVSAGFGLRIDVEFVLIRFDLGIPLRKPYKVDSPWVVDQIDFSKDWRKENLILNIAIGYPF